MKKRLLLAVLACAPVVVHAEEFIDPSSIEVVHVSVTLYRDKTRCNDEQWQRVINPAVVLQQKEVVELEDAIELIDAVTHSMRSMTRTGDNGILGEIFASMSDGQCTTRCAQECPCKANRGVCLCSVKGTSCEESCGCPEEDPADTNYSVDDIFGGNKDGENAEIKLIQSPLL